MEERRVVVQGDNIYRNIDIPAGTISWDEHSRAWNKYAEEYGNDQSAERIAERGGFSYVELVMLLGRKPYTWIPRDMKNRREK